MQTQIDKHSNAYMLHKGAKAGFSQLFQAPRPASGTHALTTNYGGLKMKKLGIRIEQDIRPNKDSLEPAAPLIAACYTRFGLIRLSVKDRDRGK